MKKVLLNGLKFFILLVLLANNVNTQHAISATTTPDLHLIWKHAAHWTTMLQTREQAFHFVVVQIKQSAKEILCPPLHFKKNDGHETKTNSFASRHRTKVLVQLLETARKKKPARAYLMEPLIS